jgi:hypothetical protein
MSGQEPGKRPRYGSGAHSRRAIRRRSKGRKTWPRSRRKHTTRLPDHGDALRIAGFLESYPGWSAFWDKRGGVWRVAEDDPHSDLYIEDAQADGVIDYIVTHS